MSVELKKSFWPNLNENRVSARLLAKIRVSQVFWDPIKNRVSPRSALLKAVYLEALLYPINITHARHYNPRFVYLLPHFSSPFLCFQGVFFEKLPTNENIVAGPSEGLKIRGCEYY